MKFFYSALKTVYGPTTLGSTSLLSPGEKTLITGKEKILNAERTSLQCSLLAIYHQ